MSMIRNSDKYDELVICSRVEVPNQILAALRQMIKTTRVQPAFTQAKIHAQHSAVNRINPLMVSALTYQEADRLTFFDPNLFIINRLPSFSGAFHQFYQTHRGIISPSLFTITPSADIAKVAALTFSQIDFSSPECLNRFAYLISNSIAFANKSIDSLKYVLSQPSASDPIVKGKLYALDFLNTKATSATRAIFELRNEELKKADPITLISIGSKAKLYKSDSWQGKISSRITITNKEKTPRKLISTTPSVHKPMKPLLISYHTDQPGKDYYRTCAERLQRQCSQFEIRHDIANIQPLGGYAVNCLLKPGFILEKMISHKEPVVWMDCDTELKASFSEFNDIDADIGMATHSGDIEGIKASPILFNYSPGAFKVVREWAIHCHAAIDKGIVELDHDAIKHYVLPALADEYTLYLLTDDWEDFVSGKYIVNGNSYHENKINVFNQVNSLTERQRWDISKDVKCYALVFESSQESVFEQAYSSLTNFSNKSRIKFYFNESLAEKESTFLNQIIVESGERVFFDNSAVQNENEVFIQVDPAMKFEKNWDILWKQ